MRIRHLGSERGDVEYIYDNNSVLEEVTNNTTNLIAHYRYADRLLSLNTPTDSQFYLFASLGTTANLLDESGVIEKSYRTDPYGEITQQEGTSVNKQVFTGQEHDEQTGLIYFGARYYDPDTARFITQDSYLGEPGVAPSLHRYLYAYANPTVWVDLYGFDACLGQELNSCKPENFYPTGNPIPQKISKDAMTGLPGMEEILRWDARDKAIETGAQGMHSNSIYSKNFRIIPYEDEDGVVFYSVFGKNKFLRSNEAGKFGAITYIVPPAELDNFLTNENMLNQLWDLTHILGGEMQPWEVAWVRAQKAAIEGDMQAWSESMGELGDSMLSKEYAFQMLLAAGGSYAAASVSQAGPAASSMATRASTRRTYVHSKAYIDKDAAYQVYVARQRALQQKPLSKREWARSKSDGGSGYDEGAAQHKKNTSSHGNTLGDHPAEIYQKYDADGNYLKTGISQKADGRYTEAEIDGGDIDIVGTRPRKRAAEIERFINERKPGPDNEEPWAGKRDPTPRNYDPDYVPPHMRKKKR